MIDYDVADYLADNGYGTLGTNIFAGFMPDVTGTSIAVYQARGYVPLNPSNIERPEVHIVVRADSSADALDKANDVFNFLNKKGDVTLNSVRYLYFRALGSPNLMYADYTHDPPQFWASIDFLVHKETE